MTETETHFDAETRRQAIIEVAGKVFARSGYAATPVTAIAEAAGISQAYVFKLFPTKLELFTAVVERCYERIDAQMNRAADKAGKAKTDKVLDAMAAAYTKLIADRDVLMLQVHAQAASDVPEIREAVRHGVSRLIATAKGRSGAKKQKVQRFIAHCQYCHLVTVLDVDDVEATWARILTNKL